LEDTVKTTREGVEETITNVKVFVGAEKKGRPAPPKLPPPPPATAQELALKVAGGVITGTAKAAWWATVGVGNAGLVGTKLAYSIVTDQIAQQRGAPTEKQVDVNVKLGKSTATFSSEEPQMTAFPDKMILNETIPRKETVSEIRAPSVCKQELDIDMDALNLEVMDALELAEMAVRIADECKNENGGNSELDEALRMASEAAILSTKEAAEIERNMNEP
jgi:hypothetical protein